MNRLRGVWVTAVDNIETASDRSYASIILLATTIAIYVHGVGMLPAVSSRVEVGIAVLILVVAGITAATFESDFELHLSTGTVFPLVIISALVIIQTARGLVIGNPPIYVIGDTLKLLVLIAFCLSTAQLNVSELIQTLQLGILFTVFGICLKAFLIPQNDITILATGTVSLIPAVILLRPKWAGRYLYSALVATFFIAGFLTMSRLIWIGIIGTAVYSLLLLTYRQGMSAELAILSFVSVLLSVLFISTNPWAIDTIVTEIQATISVGASIQGRILEAEIVLNAWRQNKLLGGGLGATIPVKEAFAKMFAEYTVMDRFHFIHSAYLVLLYRIGIVGLLSYILLLIRGLRVTTVEALTGSEWRVAGACGAVILFGIVAGLVSTYPIGIASGAIGGIILGAVDVISRT
ncbi:O-antigen ligase family protein [Haloarcula rubripromontorii]|uniref:O-antigen ligase family protein n=1 Tax=Haloarcula rubripromontorii TaxID=1705562 RepID=UPI00345C156C